MIFFILKEIKMENKISLDQEIIEKLKQSLEKEKIRFLTVKKY